MTRHRVSQHSKGHIANFRIGVRGSLREDVKGALVRILRAESQTGSGRRGSYQRIKMAQANLKHERQVEWLRIRGRSDEFLHRTPSLPAA